MTVVEECSAIVHDARTVEQAIGLGSSYGGLHIASHLSHLVVSTKPVFEYSHTGQPISRNKTDGEPGYIEPNNFLVRVRLPALPLAHELWTAPRLSDGSYGLVRSVAQTGLEIAHAEGEESRAPPSPAEGAAPGGPTASLFRQPAVLDEARIAHIQEMGFPK